MKRLISLFLFIAVIGLSCSTPKAPTPFAMGNLVEVNNQALVAWMACSDGPNYTPEKEGCNVEDLLQKNQIAQDTAYEFMRGDPKQPQGFDIYLEQVLISFRIKHAELTAQDYIEKERIAEQFFETQKATSGRSLVNASYLFTLVTAETASYQYYNAREDLTIERRATLNKALNAGAGVFDLVTPERNRRLRDALQVLEFIIAYINSTL